MSQVTPAEAATDIGWQEEKVRKLALGAMGLVAIAVFILTAALVLVLTQHSKARQANIYTSQCLDSLKQSVRTTETCMEALPLPDGKQSRVKKGRRL